MIFAVGGFVGIGRHVTVVVICVLQTGDGDLFDVIQAAGVLSVFSCFIQSGHQHCRKNGDNGNHYKKFNQRKAVNRCVTGDVYFSADRMLKG